MSKCEHCGHDPDEKYIFAGKPVDIGFIHDLPEYRFGSPKDRILKHLDVKGMNTLSRIMHDTLISGLYDFDCAMSELIDEGKVGKTYGSDEVTEFFLIKEEIEVETNGIITLKGEPNAS